jgi:predicted phosphodiesterase
MLHTAFSKTRRPFGQPVADAKGHPKFIRIPKTPPQNLVLPLETVYRGITEKLAQAGKLVFHTVGDTGPIKGDEAIKIIADQMEAQFAHSPKLDHPATLEPDEPGRPMPEEGDPSFFYHLGDVVYFNGVSTDYPAQFYEPYQFYPARIFAIPGNHDGDNKPRPTDPPDSEPSLEGFFENFCDDQPRHLSAYRPTMTQPYVYWTLDAPFATIVGLYSNVDGSLDANGVFQQQAWLRQQLEAASADKCLILTVHHACFSLDDNHGGYPDILAALMDAANASGRWPDIVLSGHVHNYQRFTQVVDRVGQIPHLVIGAGGYADTLRAMHKMQRDPERGNAPITEPFDTDMAGVRLESYNEVDPGFGRITVDDQNLTFEYFACPFEGPVPEDPFDSFTLNWKRKRITASSPGFRPDEHAKTPTHPKRRGAGAVAQGWPPTGPTRDRHSVQADPPPPPPSGHNRPASGRGRRR